MLNRSLLFLEGRKFISGVDEVGRGALAGPLYAGAVGFEAHLYRKIKQSQWSEKVRDSKKLSPKLRLELSLAIEENLPYGTGFVSVKEINAWGLTRANQVAIRRAMEKLPKANLIIGDGNLVVPRSFVQYQPIIKADETIWLVAAASIIAKVARDQIMKEVEHLKFPQYHFDLHVGYGTKLHLETIKKFGPCPIHRLKFKTFDHLIFSKSN